MGVSLDHGQLASKTNPAYLDPKQNIHRTSIEEVNFRLPKVYKNIHRTSIEGVNFILPKVTNDIIGLSH